MTPRAAWALSVDPDRIAWLTLDKPDAGANALSRDVLTELDARLADLERIAPRGVVVISGKDSGFIAGADIKEFTTLEDTADAEALIDHGQRVLARLERLPCPTVAALHGYALGGGLELALACRYRVAVEDERLALGLPEVMLGIHPGFGGTVRAVRLIGALDALDLMLTGRTVRGRKARALGLVDRGCASRAELPALARRCIVEARPAHRPNGWRRLVSSPLVRPLLRNRLRATVARRVREAHYPSPYAIIDLWVRYGADPRTGYEAEKRSIAKLAVTATARNLVRVFLLQGALKSQGAKQPQAIERVHVIGAGVMGGDIAAWCALRGLQVTLQDREARYVQPALARAEALFDKKIRDDAARVAARSRLIADVEGTGLATADVVIEAIVEDVAVKRALYADIEARLKPDAVLATNTSSIVLEELAAALTRPGRLVGLHFFNPVAQMPLVEIVCGAASAPASIATAIALTRKLDKLPLPCRSAPGFVVNRVLVPYMFEAMHMAAEGHSIAAIDAAAKDFGMPMGPVELADTVGLDVCWHVGRIVSQALGQSLPDLSQLEGRVAAVELGRKSNRGFYLWEDGRTRGANPALPTQPNASTDASDLQDRLVLALANESVAVLRDGIVESADRLDSALIFGAGYAPFRGGPMQAARERGIDDCVARLQTLAARYGARFSPDAGWQSLRAAR